MTLDTDVQRFLLDRRSLLTGLSAAGLLALLPGCSGSKKKTGTPSDPYHAYSAGGSDTWAFALGAIDEVSDAPAGFGTAIGALQYPQVTVRLLGLMGDLPGVPTPSALVELVAGSWTVDQLAGARLAITTASADPTSTAGAPPDQVTVRAPLMRVHAATPLVDTTDTALWSPRVATPPAPASGTPFSLSGARYSEPAQPGGPVVGPYGPISQLDDGAHAAALSSVSTLQVTANGGAFPDV